MNDLFEEASEVGEVPYEGLTTPGTIFTSSPWMNTNRSPDTGYINTTTQTASPKVFANTSPDSNFFNAVTHSMSTTDKVDSWFASTPAGPSQSSMSRPNTRDTALTSLPGDESQLPNQNTGEAFFDQTCTGPSARHPFLDSFVVHGSQLPTAQMDASTTVPDLLIADRSKTSTSREGTRDPFFDSVPTGPSQLSTLCYNARAPAFNPSDSTREQAPVSPWNKTETYISPAERVQDNPRPRLILRISNKSIDSDNFRSAPQMATHSEIPDSRADAPHTTGSLVPAVRPSTPRLQGPQRQAPRRADMLNPAVRPSQSKFSGPRVLSRRTNHTVMQPAEVSHTNSRVWSSNLAVEKDRWQRVEESLGRMNLLRSAVVPKTLKDWLAHQRGRADAKKHWEQKKLDDMNRTLRDPRLPPPGRPVKVGPAFRGRAFEHKNYSSVLVFPSVWSHAYDPPPERPNPLWPCVEEMKEEGDERNTSGFRRFPGLPRVPANDTVQYKLRAIQPFLPFDTIWELPTRKSVEAANEKYSPEESEKMEEYLGESLLDALDCITEDSF